MKTSRPFATISYNTDRFLRQVLDDLIRRDAISFYCWIEHLPEEDEKKSHKHLFIAPNGQLETNGIRKLLEEIDWQKLKECSMTQTDLETLEEQKKREYILGCLDFRPSKFDDWYLYGIHDSSYLASKGQTRKYHYQEKDIVTSNEDSLHERICTIDFSKYRKTQDFVNAVISGVSFYDMVAKGQIPAPQFVQWKNLYDFIYCHTNRNGGETHTPALECDPNTGEVIEN